MSDKILLTGDDVADILKVSRSFAYKLMRQGEIRVVRLGRAVRVRPEDLDAFIKANLTHQITLTIGGTTA